MEGCDDALARAEEKSSLSSAVSCSKPKERGVEVPWSDGKEFK